MSKDKVIDRIMKCLKLGESSNTHEAAAAVLKARELMDRYGISDKDLQYAQVEESHVKQRWSPKGWHIRLAQCCRDCFGVAYFYSQGYDFGNMIFVGHDVQAELASYAYTVLRRKCAADRQKFFKSIRGKRANRIQRADVYALAWAAAVHLKVAEFASRTPSKSVIEYISERYPELFTETVGGGHNCRYKDAVKGAIDGQSVELFGAMNGREREHAMIGGTQ